MSTFETKMKKCLNFEMKKCLKFQIDLDSDLKEEPALKSKYWFTLLRPVIQGS